MSAVAITGAAVSPTMGRFTKRWLRAVLCLTNVRLGVWIRTQRRQGFEINRLHRFLYAGFNREDFGCSFGNCAVGTIPNRSSFMCRTVVITINLGIVELVRLGCTEIWSVDASADTPGASSALAESLGLISSELGYEVEFDFSKFSLDEESNHTGHPPHQAGPRHWCIAASNNWPRVHTSSHSYWLRQVLDSRLTAMQGRHRQFPYDSTLRQFFNAERFDLYRDLGFHSTMRAVNAAKRKRPAPLD